jgi:hypothetical protein
MLEGPTPGRIIMLPEGKTTLGRSEKCAVVVPARALCQFHMEVRVDGDRASVRDLMSTGGTFVNHVLAREPITLREGDRIRAGSLLLEFGWDFPEGEVPYVFGSDLPAVAPPPAVRSVREAPPRWPYRGALVEVDLVRPVGIHPLVDGAYRISRFEGRAVVEPRRRRGGRGAPPRDPG